MFHSLGRTKIFVALAPCSRWNRRFPSGLLDAYCSVWATTHPLIRGSRGRSSQGLYIFARPLGPHLRSPLRRGHKGCFLLLLDGKNGVGAGANAVRTDHNGSDSGSGEIDRSQQALDNLQVSGSSSAVERQLPKLDVTGSIPVSRSISLSFCCLSPSSGPIGDFLLQ